MKRKPIPDAVVSNQILDQVAQAQAFAVPQRRAKCFVCGDDTAPNSSEGLCWVCRHLKTSAWRDSDTQMPAQE